MSVVSFIYTGVNVYTPRSRVPASSKQEWTNSTIFCDSKVINYIIQKRVLTLLDISGKTEKLMQHSEVFNNVMVLNECKIRIFAPLAHYL